MPSPGSKAILSDFLAAIVNCVFYRSSFSSIYETGVGKFCLKQNEENFWEVKNVVGGKYRFPFFSLYLWVTFFANTDTPRLSAAHYV